MDQKPLLFLFGLMVIALILIVVYQTQTDPFKNVKTHTHNQQQHDHDAELKAIYAVYMKNCSDCHGAEGQGLGGYPDIRDTKMSIEQIKQRIITGKGDMPDFKNEIKEPMLTRLAQMVKQF
ncbi:MAG TPA: cytochrome c [Calditrichaeota bacterium]|nr:cytochrome c [Calditrichota bacterium]